MFSDYIGKDVAVSTPDGVSDPRRCGAGSQSARDGRGEQFDFPPGHRDDVNGGFSESTGLGIGWKAGLTPS